MLSAEGGEGSGGVFLVESGFRACRLRGSSRVGVDRGCAPILPPAYSTVTHPSVIGVCPRATFHRIPVLQAFIRRVS